MMQYNSVNIKLSNSQLNNLVSTIKKCYWSNLIAIVKYDRRF